MIALAAWWNISHGAVIAIQTVEAWIHSVHRNFHQSLARLGALQRVRLDSTQLRGGTKHYALTLNYPHRQLQVAEYDLADGKIEQFLIDDKP